MTLNFCLLFAALLAYFPFFITSTAINGVDYEQNLIEFLKGRLTKYTHPFDMVNNTVFIYFDLYQILEVDEKNGMLQAKFWLYYYYYAPSADWEPEDYGNISTLLVPARTFWTPSIIVLDGVELDYEAYRDQIVYSFGLVGGWSSLVTMEVSCSYDVTNFPYDSQECPVSFGPWAVDNDVYRLGIDPTFGITHEIELEYFTDHDQWHLERPLVSELNERQVIGTSKSDQLIVHMKLTRLPDFYAHVLLFPTIILDILSPLTFLLPVESGEKMSLAITVLLAEVVTYSQLIDILPASSRNFPILGFFVTSVVVQMSLACIFTAIVLSTHYVGGRRKMGHQMRVLISSQIMTYVGLSPCPKEKALLTPKSPVQSEMSSGNTINSKSSSQNRRSNGRSKATVSPILDDKNSGEIMGGDVGEMGAKESCGWDRAKEAAKLESDENTELLWQFFAAFLDRIFFFIYCVIAAGVLSSFWIQIKT